MERLEEDTLSTSSRSGAEPAIAAAPPPVAATVRPLTVFLVAMSIIAVLVVLSTTVTVGAALWPHSLLAHDTLNSIFSNDSEAGIGTVYSVLQLAFASLCAAGVSRLVRRQGRRWSREWAGVAVALGAVMLDEVLMLHERLNDAMSGDSAGGTNSLPWVYPALALVCVLGIVFLRFVVALPRPVRGLVVLAACMFVAGAAGLEKLGAETFDWFGNTAFVVTFNIEELFEMTAVAIMIYATLRFATDHLDHETLTLEVGNTAGDGTGRVSS